MLNRRFKYIRNFSLIPYTLYLLPFALFLIQCAQIVSPAGGPKDIAPPRAVKYIPDSAKVNFAAKRVTVSFDEYIQLNELQKQLVISPPMKVQPEIKIKGKSLYIEIEDTLKKNVTYSINFGEAIKDITENNVLSNFSYLFSTGDHIDTLSVSGMVKYAQDMKTEKGILVMIYDTHEDSVPCKKLPSYYTKTREDGSYKISNIRPGTYKIFALKDANANYIYDLPTEEIAFSDTLITVSKNRSLNLFLFREEPKMQRLLKAYFPEHGHLFLSFAKPSDESFKFNFFSQEPKQNVVYEYSKNNDTLHFWFADDLKDTMKIQLVQGEKILDTVRIKPIPVDVSGNSGRGDKWGLKVSLNMKMAVPFDLNRNSEIYLSHPLLSAKKDPKISFKRDSMDISSVFTSVNFEKYKYKRRIPIDSSKAKENATYHLFIPPGTFTDIFGLTNDTVKLDFKSQEEKNYGTLKLKLKMSIRINYILQLLNDRGEIYLYTSSDKGVFTYEFLPPGAYRLRIIYDKNGDGKWTTGNYLMKKKPETVIYYPAPLNIRSSWENEAEWKVE
jgi:uncharacterized protein (DUF2141 family)